MKLIVVISSSSARSEGAVLPRRSRRPNAGGGDDYFVQLSDTHWGFNGPAVNPDARGTLPKAIEAVNALPAQPDFIVFTGDLTHTTDDPKERRKRLAEFREIAKGLKKPNVRFMAGEHDAPDRRGVAEFFGETHTSTRACTSSPSTTSPTRRALGEAQLRVCRRSREAARKRASWWSPAGLRPRPAWTGDSRRRAGGHLLMPFANDGVLAHPPGAPP